MLKRISLLAILLIAVVLLAACDNDLPTDTTGCKADPANPEGKVYSRDAGCLHGSIIAEHGAEEDHGETTTEDEHGEEGEAEEEHTEEATAEPNN